MNVLLIDCSPRPESHSRKLSAAIVARLLAMDPAAHVTRRDLGRQPIPHAEKNYATALSSPGELASWQSDSAVRLSEQLIQEVEAADVLVIGTPMNNFTVPSVLKAWIDQVLRMGRTIGTAPTGEKIGSSRMSGEGGLDLQKEVISVTVPVSHALDHFDFVVDPFKLTGMHWPAHSCQDASPVRLQY